MSTLRGRCPRQPIPGYAVGFVARAKVRQEVYMSLVPNRSEATPPHGGAQPSDPLRAIEERAEAGDIVAVLEFWAAAPAGAYSFGQRDRLLRRAIEQASRKSPNDFTDAVYRQ